MLPVSEHDIADVSHAQTVDQNSSVLYMAGHFCAFAVNLQHIAALEHQYML